MSFENFISIIAIIISIIALMVSFVFSYENPILLLIKNRAKMQILKNELIAYYKNINNFNYFIENSKLEVENYKNMFDDRLIEFIYQIFVSKYTYSIDKFSSNSPNKYFLKDTYTRHIADNLSFIGYLLFLNDSKLIDVLFSNANFKYTLFENTISNINEPFSIYSNVFISKEQIVNKTISDLFFEYRDIDDYKKNDCLYFELLIAVTILDVKSLKEVTFNILNKYKYRDLNDEDLVYFIEHNKLDNKNIIQFMSKFQYFSKFKGVIHSTNLFEEIDNLKLPIENFIDDYLNEDCKENIKAIIMIGVLFCEKNRHNIDLKNPNNKIEFSISEKQYTNFIKYYIDYKEGKYNNEQLKHFTDTVVKNIEKLNIPDS